MGPEFIAIIVFGTIRLVALLILGLMLRDVFRMTRDVTVSTSIPLLQGRRIKDVLREPSKRPHS
jgi:hypothetical protein